MTTTGNKLVEDTTSDAQIDNTNIDKDVKNEAQRSANEKKKQLEELNKKYSDLQTEYSFARAVLALKDQASNGKELAASANKITALTLELGEQRKQNEELRQNLEDLFANLTSYQAGHIRNSIESDVNEKGKDDKVKNRASASPTWGKIKKNQHRPLRIWNPKEIAQRHSRTVIMVGENLFLGQINVDELLHVMIGGLIKRQRSPSNPKYLSRDAYTRKRSASPTKEAQPLKIALTRDAWISGGKEAVSQWTGVDQLRKTIRSLGHSDTKNMITRVKELFNKICACSISTTC